MAVASPVARCGPAVPAGPHRRPPAPAGRNRLTGRATVLFVVLALLAVAYTWPVKEYLRQRSELGRLRAETAATQARVDALQALRQRWADPAYVQAQARERLHFVLPGETAYVVLQPDHPAAPQTLPKPTDAGAAARGTTSCGTACRAPTRPRRTERATLDGVALSGDGEEPDGARPGWTRATTPRWPPSWAASRGASSAVAHRCPCGLPDVVRDRAPAAGRHAVPDAVLPDLSAGGRPPSARWSRPGMMREMTERLGADPELAAAYRRAHEAYVAARERLGVVPEIAGVSAGGMPDRVKCLHVLVAHALAAGPGVNPLGDEALAAARPVVDGGTLRGAGRRDRAVTSADAGWRRSTAARTRSGCWSPTSTRSTGTLVDLDRTMQIVRLGEGVDRTGRLSEAALARTFAVCDVYAARDRASSARRGCASSRRRRRGTRRTRDDVRRGGARADRAYRPRWSSGDEEARLSFAGATRELAGREPAPYLVVDIGGGSTELVLGDTAPVAARSVDVGCVRITERHLHSDPPTAGRGGGGARRHRGRPSSWPARWSRSLRRARSSGWRAR